MLALVRKDKKFKVVKEHLICFLKFKLHALIYIILLKVVLHVDYLHSIHIFASECSFQNA